jgi:hypothetical protein
MSELEFSDEVHRAMRALTQYVDAHLTAGGHHLALGTALVGLGTEMLAQHHGHDAAVATLRHAADALSAESGGPQKH